MLNYYVDKRSGTSADLELAGGFAKLVRDVLIAAGRSEDADEIRMIDSGPYYTIEVPAVIEDADIERINALPLLQHLDTASQQGALGTHFGHGFPYDRERQTRDIFREKMKQLPPEARSPDARLFGHPALDELVRNTPPPDTLLPLYLIISQMKVAPSFNEPAIRWRELSDDPALLRAHVRLLLDLFSARPNPLDEVVSRWRLLAQDYKLGDPDMTMLQVINPTTGKGANSRKANALTIGGQKEFWLLELLKFVGFFVLAHPQTISNTKDRKTYVLRPRNIRLNTIDAVMQKFRDVLWSSTPVKLDVLTVLQFSRVLIERDRQALRQETKVRRTARKPSERIHGFDATFYKDMGSAFAVMNIASLNLPEWLPRPATIADADRSLTLLKEHIDVISSIRARDGEERTEEHELLRRYRDFVSGRAIEPFLDFAALFAPYISRNIERVKPFSVPTLQELIAMTKNDLTQITTNKGFLRIAAAIRESTLRLQYKKGKRQPIDFDIRYGINQDLVRRSNHTDEFVEALSEFVASYNTETTRKYEVSEGSIRRMWVDDSDVAEVVRLLAEGFSSKTIARLLVAFGSAWSGDKPNKPSATSEDFIDAAE